MANILPSLPSNYVSQYKHANIEGMEAEHKKRVSDARKRGEIIFDHSKHKPYAC